MLIGFVIPHNFYAPWDFVRSTWRIPAEFMPPIDETGADCALNRERLLERAKKKNEDILFIDSDAEFTTMDIFKMADRLKEKPVVTGVCLLGDPPHLPSIFKWDNDKVLFESIQPEGFQKVDACGAAFLGISSRIYGKLSKNPFRRNDNFGTDLSFCRSLTNLGIEIWCDSDIRIGHIKPKVLR